MVKATAPPDLITVAILFIDEGEDEEIGAACLRSANGRTVRLRAAATARQVEH